jgi:FKBP-type peptidyl-prolyl cis-trans isomerase FkpA/FKBP-type peptidyl-prolyl cis-trans isomerase FklB
MRTLLCLLSATSLLASATALAAADPKTEDQKTLYALGLAVSRNLGTFDLKPAEIEYLKAGMEDGLLNRKPKVELEAYGPKIGQLQQARLGASAEKAKQAGKVYADKVAKEKGAVKKPSGLIIVPMKEGTGAMPVASDTVKVHYHGTLTDGKVLDSSVKRGQPAEFPLTGVIPCWTEALQLIKVGGKAKIVCPPEIAYGERGSPPAIPPGATITFEVELLDIIKAPKVDAPAPAPEGDKK